MATENILSVVEREMKQHLKVLPKPLPQILDEMDDNIRAAAEAARRAEEAAKAGREAAEAATKASGEAQKRAIEAREAAMKAAEDATRAAVEAAAKAEKTALATKAAMLQRIESLEERLKNLEDDTSQEEVIVLREISKEEAKKEILELFSQGQTLYYSDIAEQLGLDLKLVVEICNELQSKGDIEIVDDTLQRR